MKAKRSATHCKARTNAGKSCRAAATAGGLCFFHANPNKAAELGRKGGRGKRQAIADILDPLPRLDKAIAVLDTLERLSTDVYSGKLEPRIAQALTPLLALQLRAIEMTDLERRIIELERQIAEASDGADDESWRNAGDLATRPKQ
jgi:hypothetical protein